MSDLTYDAPRRTPAQAAADDITRHAAAIRRGWVHMLPDNAPAQRMGRTAPTALIVHEDDHDPAEDDLDPHTLLMHRRRNAVEVLNSWCRAVMDDRNITNPATLPLGNDAPGMCSFIERHADWIGWQDYATDCRDELDDIARQVGAYSNPWRREFHRVGACPFVVEGGGFCTGTVRVQIGADETEATCSECEQTAPIEWWEEVMGVVVHVEAVRATALAAILADRLKVTVTERTIRNWCRDGRLSPLVAFGPQPNPEGKPSYWFDARRAVEEVALMDRPCSLCGRLWSGRGAVCGRCYTTVAHSRATYTDREDGQWVATGQVVQSEPALQVCSIVERARCSYSDLPKAWCACAKCTG